jgi:hypothetical protein
MTRSAEEIQINDSRAALYNKEDNSENKLQIMYFNFLLNIFGLLVPNDATLFVRFLHRVFLTCVFSLFTITLLGQLSAIFVHWGDIPLLASTMSVTSGLILSTISCGYFLRKKRIFMRLIDVLRMDLLAEMRSKYVRFPEQAERQIKMFVFITVQTIIACFVIWVLAAYLNRDDVNVVENNSTAGEYDVKRMIYVMWAPFEIEKSPQFEIISVLQIIVAALAASMLLAVDTVFLSLMAHAAAQFKVLCAMLNDMHQNIAESDPHTTRRTSPLHLSTADSAVTETLTSVHGNIPHEYPGGTERRCGSTSSEPARAGDTHTDEDPFRTYIVKCIKHHQAIIE